MHAYMILLAYMHMCLDARAKKRYVWVSVCLCVLGARLVSVRVTRDSMHTAQSKITIMGLSLGHKEEGAPILALWKADGL